MVDYTLKFCLLLTVWDIILYKNTAPVVSGNTMEKAIALSRYFIENAEQVVVGKLDSKAVQLETKIVDKLKASKKKTMSRTELMRKFKSSKKDFDNAVDNLLDQQIIVEKTLKDSKKGKKVYILI